MHKILSFEKSRHVAAPAHSHLLDLESQKLAEGWPWIVSIMYVKTKVMGQMARS